MREPKILYGALNFALATRSLEKGRHTDIQAIPAHMARGSPNKDVISSAVETMSVRRTYHQFLAEWMLNSRNKSRNVRRYGRFFLVFIKYCHTDNHSNK